MRQLFLLFIVSVFLFGIFGVASADSEGKDTLSLNRELESVAYVSLEGANKARPGGKYFWEVFSIMMFMVCSNILWRMPVSDNGFFSPFSVRAVIHSLFVLCIFPLCVDVFKVLNDYCPFPSFLHFFIIILVGHFIFACFIISNVRYVLNYDNRFDNAVYKAADVISCERDPFSKRIMEHEFGNFLSNEFRNNSKEKRKREEAGLRKRYYWNSVSFYVFSGATILMHLVLFI